MDLPEATEYKNYFRQPPLMHHPPFTLVALALKPATFVGVETQRNKGRTVMKSLLSAMAILMLIVTPINPLIAAQHGMGQGSEEVEDMKAQRSQGMTAEEAEKEAERQMEQERERERERMMNDGQGERGMEQQREMTQEQKELGEGTGEGEEKKERKWWRFWE